MFRDFPQSREIWKTLINLAIRAAHRKRSNRWCRSKPPRLRPSSWRNSRSGPPRPTRHWDRLLRTTADFDNFKKRAAREKQEAIKFANESLLEKLLPVLDNFDMALAAAQDSPTEAGQSLQAGVSMIYQQLKSVLAEAGLEEMDATGKPFDPNLHEAVSQQETRGCARRPGRAATPQRLQAARPALRPASVIVAKQPAA